MRTLHVPAVSIFLVTLLAFSTACSRHPSDETIARDIQTKVAADPQTKDSNVLVEAKEGKITLSGQVTTPAAKRKLEQIVQQEVGVAGFEDQTALQPIVVPQGTVLAVSIAQALGSGISQTGQTFLATLAQPVNVSGITALPAGSTANGAVVTAKAKGKVKVPTASHVDTPARSRDPLKRIFARKLCESTSTTGNCISIPIG